MPPPTPKHFTYAHTIMSRFIDPSDPGNTANLMKGVAAINDWLSGWFRYSPLTPGTDAAKLSEADKAQRYIAPEANPIRASTRSAEADDPAFSACNEFAAAANEALILHELSTPQIGEGVLHTAARNVLFTDPSVTLWPGMRVECVYCANSCWTCVYAGETIKTSFESAVPGRKVRVLDDANHFVSVLWICEDGCAHVLVRSTGPIRSVLCKPFCPSCDHSFGQCETIRVLLRALSRSSIYGLL
jgi:hypothetical protein